MTKEDLNILENTEREVSSRPRPYRISEEEYAKGHYLPKQDLHHILETLYKLKLQSQDESGRTGFLIARRQRHPGSFLLTDSESARNDLHALIPLTDLLGQIQEMPKDMVDLDQFEYIMALKQERIRPTVKKAILDGITYTDKDGQEKPLAQFYVRKSQFSNKDYYGICVPQTAQGQKALLKLAGFNIHTCDLSKVASSSFDKMSPWFDDELEEFKNAYIIYKTGIKKCLSQQELAEYYNVSPERIRQTYAKIYRHMIRVDVFKQSSLPQDKSIIEGSSLGNNDALYITDSNDDSVITQAALKRGLIKGCCAIPRRCTSRTKEQIIHFDYSCRTHE